MKSLPLLTLAALAAFVPGTHASDGAIKRFIGNPESHIPGPHFDSSPFIDNHDIQEQHILPKLPNKDIGNYSQVNTALNKFTKNFRKTARERRIVSLLKPFGIVFADKFDILQDLGIKFQPLGAKPSVPLEAIIKGIGPVLFKSPEMAEKLATLLMQSPPGDTKANTATNAVVTVDPHRFVQLCRTVGPESDTIYDLLTQSAAQFKNGLGIDKTWNDDLLQWFTTSFVTEFSHPAIRFSRNDVSTMLAWIALSHPKLQQLSPKPSLTVNDLTEITQRMRAVVKGIANSYNGFKIQPPLNLLLQLEAGPLEAHPKPFDITTGFKAFVNLDPRPSIISLYMGLTSLLDRQLPNFSHSNSDLNSIISCSLVATGVSTEDMSWLIQDDLHRIFRSTEFHTLGKAFKVMCGGVAASHLYPNCPKSNYFMTAPNNGVMSWPTQLSLIRELVRMRRYASAKRWLSELFKLNLVPDLALEKAMTVYFYIGDTKDGGKIGNMNLEAISAF